MNSSATLRAQEKFAEAQAFEARGELEAAEATYRQLLAAHPGQPALLARLALVRKERGAFSEAEGLLRRAIAAAPEEAALYSNLGNVLRNLERLADAEASYRKALAIDPAFGEASYNLGTVLEDGGRHDEALAAYRDSIARGYSNPSAKVRVAAILLGSEKPTEALTILDSVVQAGATFEAHYYRGLALAQMERFEDAAAELRRAASLKPESTAALGALANSLRNANRFDEALDVQWRLVEIAPADAVSHEALNRLAWMAGRNDLFLRSFAYARDRGIEDPALLASEAQMRLQRNDPRGAEPLLRRALEIAPAQANAAALLGRLLSRRGRHDESFQAFTQAIRTEPNFGAYRNEFGYALLKGGEARPALAQFEAARRLNPVDQLALAGVCLAYRALGDSRYQRLVDIDSFVRVYRLDVPAGYADSEAFNRALGEELLALHTTTAEPLDQTLHGGTQTEGLLFNRKGRAIAQVREQIWAIVGDYVASMAQSHDHPLLSRKEEAWSFTHSWSCKLRSSGFHSNHVHPMGWISSAYYVALPDALNDTSTKQGWLKFGESNLELGGDDRPEHFVKPEVGQLVLFPSYFWHGTVPFDAADDRLTIAFDAVPGMTEPLTLAMTAY
jgi:tetratricopeptide (TPR) repeat protein